MSKLNYEETVKEIKELQKKIRAYQKGKHDIEDYVGSLKRLQFLRNSIRALKKRKVNEENK